MTDRAEPRPTGPLRPIELATGAVLGGMVVALTVVASAIPLAGSLQLLAPVPLGIVAVRHRLRALIAATVAAAVAAFVAAGLLPAIAVLSSAVLGGLVGGVKRRGRGFGTALGFGVPAALAHGVVAVGLLALFDETRRLMFDAARNSAQGMARIAAAQPDLRASADEFIDLVDTLIAWWWLWIGGSVAFFFLVGTVFAWFVLGGVLDRLAWLPGVDRLDAPDEVSPVASLARGDRPVGPLPVRLDRVGYRYPGSAVDALADIDLQVAAGEFVAVVGANGSGKSTLTRVLAGRPPTSGTVSRPGAAGLGRFGGTAVVLQRPESQTLGVLVADDVVWGLPPGTEVDVAGLLDEVGLGGLGGRATAALSGGQLQRLAVAAALARRPALLIADEATAMLDPAGRADLVELLAALPKRHDMAVVLVTHHRSDAAAADRVVHLAGGRTVDAAVPWWPPARAPIPAPGRPGEALLELAGVRYIYNSRTPWATPALHGIDLTVHRGEGVLVVGGNGSGKSTLAWIMAGLLTPDEGTCLLGRRPVDEQVGSVALAFQHARLQLQRRTVGEEIASWGHSAGSGAVGRALDAVGLDRLLAGRPIDELSGGQARRVALAGILAAGPQLIVLDEPLAGLDPIGRREIVELLARLRATGRTLVVISHDIDELAPACSRIVTIESGRLGTGPALVAGGPRT